MSLVCYLFSSLCCSVGKQPVGKVTAYINYTLHLVYLMVIINPMDFHSVFFDGDDIDAVRFHHKIPVDSNGNCEIGDKVSLTAFHFEYQQIQLLVYSMNLRSVYCLPAVDQWRVFGRNPGDVIDNNFTRTTVSAGERGTLQ